MDWNESYWSSADTLNAYADSVLEGLESSHPRASVLVGANKAKMAETINVIKSNSVDLDHLASSYFTRILNGIDAEIHNRNDRDSALNNAYSAASALNEFFADKPVLEVNGLKSAAMYLNSMVGELKSYSSHRRVE